MYIYIYIHTYLYIYIYVYTHICLVGRQVKGNHRTRRETEAERCGRVSRAR